MTVSSANTNPTDMHANARQSSKPRSPGRRGGLRLLALLAIPVLLLLHAPVLAALVPGALLTIASLESLDREQQALPAADIITNDDHVDLHRLAEATPVTGTSRRIG